VRGRWDGRGWVVRGVRLIALTRAVSDSLGDCELTYRDRSPIDVARAKAQHAEYERALASLGATIVRIEADDTFPDAVFIEDAAVAFDEVAIISRPGAESRRGETAAVASVLSAYRPLVALEAPATLDGGDVMRVDRRVYVGRSARTNDAGIAAFDAALAPLGYRVVPVPLGEALHLKTACTYAGRGVILANPGWVDTSVFAGYEVLPAREAWGASVLDVGGTLVMPASYPRTRDLLESRGFKTVAVDLSELQKAEGGPTCLSILLTADDP
jgi:dimethylargininase